MEDLKIKTTYFANNKNIIIIQLSGYIDQSNSHQIEKIIYSVLQSGKKLIIFDLHDLIYMSSAGWGIFVGEIKSVREKGGDIKISGMSPEIYEVYQMLEFYHIIEDYPSIEEAVDSIQEKMNFDYDPTKQSADQNPREDIINDLLLKSGVETSVIAEGEDKIIQIDPAKRERDRGNVTKDENNEASALRDMEFSLTRPEKEIDLRKLPLAEKIKRIVANYPTLTFWQIRKMLMHEKFGEKKMTIYRLYLQLKQLNLDNRYKRFRFYRSV